MGRTLARIVVTLAGCGRIGFGALGSSADAVGDDGTVVGLDTGTCAAPSQITLDGAGSPEGSWIAELTATKSTTGFILSYLAPDGVAWASAYTMGSPITQSLQDRQVQAGPASAISAIDANNQYVLAWQKTATSSEIDGLNEAFGGFVSPVTFASAIPVATALAIDNTSSVVAYAYQEPTTQDVFIATYANNAASPGTLAASGSTAPVQFTLATGAAGFIGTWVNTTSPVHLVIGQQFDATGTAYGAVLAIPSLVAAHTPQVAFAKDANIYAFTYEDGGAIYVLLTDTQLDGLTPGAAMLPSSNASAPRIATDGQSFWIVWHDPASPTLMTAAHVLADGTFAVRPIAGAQTSVAFNFVTIDSTVQLAWSFEVATMQPDVWIVPACNL